METAAPPQPESPPEQTPFQRWLEPARPQAKLWKTIIGLVIVVLIWAVWTVVVLIAGIIAQLVSQREAPDGADAVTTLVRGLTTGATPLDMMIMLATFFGLWIGVWVAVAAMHGRKFSTVFSAERRLHWRQFGLGFLIIAVYVGIGLALSFATGDGPYRSSVTIGAWLAFAIPIVALIFFQSAGEELLFRGYLIQNLAGRFRSPIIWGFIPAVLFGLGHFGGDSTLALSIYHVAATILFGITAAAVVWRTGGISATIGMHVCNNMAAFLIAGSDDTMNSTQLFLWHASGMANGAWLDLLSLAVLLVYVLSPLAPFEGRPLFGRRNETRAAP